MEGCKTNEKAQNNDFDTLSHKTGILFHSKQKKKGKTQRFILAQLTPSVINCEK